MRLVRAFFIVILKSSDVACLRCGEEREDKYLPPRVTAQYLVARKMKKE